MLSRKLKHSIAKTARALSPIASDLRLVTNTFLTLIVRTLLAYSMVVACAFEPLRAEQGEEPDPTIANVLATEPAHVKTAAISSNAQELAEPWILPAKLHPWAHLAVGAWREVEITTETFDEKGELFGRSVTSQKEILKAVTADSYALDVQATVDVSGKRIEGPWNTRVLRLTTDRPGPVFSTTRQADQLLALNVGEVSCQIWDVQYTEEGHNLVDRIYYSPEEYPYILQREVSERADDSPVELPPLDSTTTVAHAIPFVLDGRFISCTSQQVVRRLEKGNTQTLTLMSSEVPGGEVNSASTDFDSSGRRIRWSVLKLVAYGDNSNASISGHSTVSSTPTDPAPK